MNTHFCTCTDTACPAHPQNHARGCDPCVKKSLMAGEIPSCFFRAVHGDLSGVHDFSAEGFARFMAEHRIDKTY